MFLKKRSLTFFTFKRFLSVHNSAVLFLLRNVNKQKLWRKSVQGNGTALPNYVPSQIFLNKLGNCMGGLYVFGCEVAVLMYSKILCIFCIELYPVDYGSECAYVTYVMTYIQRCIYHIWKFSMVYQTLDYTSAKDFFLQKFRLDALESEFYLISVGVFIFGSTPAI